MAELAFSYQFGDAKALLQEFHNNLSKGRAFVANAQGAQPRQVCLLRLVHPVTGAELALSAEAVFVQEEGQHRGIGFELCDWNEQQAEALKSFIEEQDQEADAADDDADDLDFENVPDDDADEPLPEQGDHQAVEGGAAEMRRTRNIYDRIRKLSSREQQLVARNGTLAERVALERCFGGGVWEGLLQNPMLSGAEVARISKKGALPKPLISMIVNNAAWLSIPEVQRALLGNPRLGSSEIVKVLRAMPRTALSRVPAQSAYRMVVRSAAKKLLKK